MRGSVGPKVRAASAGAEEAVPPAAHGTNVDGLWLRANAPKVLKLGATIQFGGSTRKYRVRLGCSRQVEVWQLCAV